MSSEFELFHLRQRLRDLLRDAAEGEVAGEPDFEASHWFPLPEQPPRALSETPSAEPLPEARKPDVEEGPESPSVNTCLREGGGL